METNEATSQQQSTKTGIEQLSKEELINKYKGVLNLAKKAKQAKDELAEENRVLKENLLRSDTQKEADKKALLTMKETLELFTEQKLKLSTELEELRQKSRNDTESLNQVRIENESLRRQMDNLTTDNETLLNDLDAMENQLKKVNSIGVEQKKQLELLELEVNSLKERDCYNASTEQRLNVCLEENKTLKEKQQEAQISLMEISEKYSKLKEINTEHRHKFNSLKDRFVYVYKQLKELKECKRVLLETQHEYADAVTKWQNEIIQASKKLCEQMHELKQENEILQKQLKMAEDYRQHQKNDINIELLGTKLCELSHLTSEAMAEHNRLHNFEQKYNENLENERASVKKISVEMEAQKLENRRLTQELSDLKIKLEDNKKALNEIQKPSSDHTLELEIAQLEREKLELQRELEAQKLKYEKLESTFQSQREALQKDLSCELQSYRQNYELKEREHTDLLGEMRELNEALKARGDVISRQEEKQQELIAELKRSISRQQQLEACLSDKEQTIVLKTQELQQVNEEFEVTKKRMQEIEANNARFEEHIAAITEELSSLKQSGQNYDAQSDTISIASNMSRADELNRLREVDENYEERYNKLRAMAVKLKKKLQEQTFQNNELTQKLQSMETLQSELGDCKAKLKELDVQKQLNESLQAEIKKLKSSRKQANVLSLEIEAAEKSLEEVSGKLNAKISELNEMSAVVETKESTIVQLRKEIAILEASKLAEYEHAIELKAQIDLLQSQIKDAVHQKQLAIDKTKDLEYTQERLQLEIEDLRLQLAQSASKHETMLSELHTENTELNSKLQEMESVLSTTQSTLKSTTQSLENMRLEYMEYKVKAQAVLRKNQTKDTTRERELEEELLEMRNKSETLEAHIQTLNQQLDKIEKQLEILKEDNDCLERRNGELNKLVDELRLHNDTLVQEQRILWQTQQDALRQQREHLDNSEAYHKEQLDTMERNYQHQIEQLKNELIKSTRQPTIIGAVAKVAPTMADSNIGIEQQKVGDFLLMERQDAEGSEEANASLSALAAKRKISNDSSSRRSLHDFMPLDELLNAPMNSLNSETVLNASGHTMNPNFEDSINANSSLDSTEHFELLAARERLQIQESRVRHLTALLAENEQDLAKLTQMNDMLKEELRRQERAVEREQHMNNLQNSEYLKNVFIKFLTLNSVDERTRLVPVLNTILKLSRSETEMLNCVAKGQKVSESNTRSWSNFLPSWGGGGNSGNQS